MALLMVSASVFLVGTFVVSDESSDDLRSSEHVADTLEAATATVDYTLRPVASDPDFANDGYPVSRFERQRYGSLTGLLADAAVADVRIDGDPLTAEGAQFTDAVRGNVLNAVTATEESVRVVSLWRPYDRSGIEGRVSVGKAVPNDEDVETTTITVTNGFPEVTEDEVRAAYGASRSFEPVADLIAERIVAGYFPPAETEMALERDQFDRALTTYRYQQLAAIVESERDPDFDPDDPSDPLSRRGADATEANERLAAGLSEIIADDMRRTFDADISPEALADAVSTEEVRITVYHWD